MAAATAVFNINNFPKGKLLYQNHIGLLGTIAISTGTYPELGIPVSFQGHGVYEGIPPYYGTLNSPTTGNNYQFDPTNQTVRIYIGSSQPSALLTTAFTASGGFGSTASTTLSATSNSSAFSATVASSGTGQGANPTLTYVFPTPYTKAPVIVVSRGNDANLDAGYWAVLDASTTTAQAVFQFVGTAVTAHSYTLDAIVIDVGTNPSTAVVAGSFALSSGWGTAAAPTITSTIPGSTQNAFSLTVTAGSAATTANPTVTLTFPTPYAVAPVFTVSDGILRPTTGHWAFTGSTTTTASFIWIGTPTATDVYVLDAVATTPTAPAITSSAFAFASGFGSTAAATSVTGNESSFDLAFSVSGSGIGANPSLTITLPSALSSAQTYVVSRADSDTNTGQWLVVDASSTTTTLVVKFFGTPVTGHSYGLSAISATPGGVNELAVGASIPPSVVADVILANVISSYS